MENTPVAPTPAAPAPEASVATPEPTNPVSDTQTTAPAPAPEISAEQVAKYLGTDTETFEKFNTFVKNNGQFDGAFKRMKDIISNPQQQTQPVTQPEPLQAPSAPQTITQPSPAPEATQTLSQSFRAGSISTEEMLAQQYFNNLANDPKYASIADEIREGKVLQGLKDFNINPLENGRINDQDVRRYLDLYAATKPAVQPSAVPEESARVDYYNVPDEKAMTYEQATQIQLQNVRLKAAGQPEHPLTAKANEVVKAHFQAKK